MKNTGKVMSLAGLLLVPWTLVSATESVQPTTCSQSNAPISFTALTTEGKVDAGIAVVPKGADVSFTVKGSYRSFPNTTLQAGAVINSLLLPNYVAVSDGDLPDFSEISFSRTFTLRAPPALPNMALKAHLSIRAPGGAEIGCFEFPLKYVAAES
ncbi:MAG TPA: hypothetical protein VM621_17560 [Luteibacter sp.]|uniref:hypothetical protein n=1 Tax=Luteibacter sp. TaxID=1886636 RepID=UPI002BA668E2|nr:hypothetical protein [Luteibacter sp.]HVI56851.1 hypothetical protein [Luteibacter sp.]